MDCQNIIMKQQNTVRKQLLELADKLDKSSHNLNAFKRRKSLAVNSTHKFMNHTLSTEIDEPKAKHHSAEKNISAILGERKSTKRSECLNNNRGKKKPHITDYYNTNYAQNFTKRRNTTNFTLLLKKDKGNSSSIPNPKADSKQKQSISQRETNFPQQQKQIFKNKSLSDTHLQEWINHILIERCPQQKFDMSLANAALKRFQIDKNSLLSYGISQTNVSRILKSLFVYSIGFNNLLAEIGNKKIQVKKNLWRVFCVLVEYCSEGSVQTILSTIQRENATQLQFVTTELEKHKKIIQNNQAITYEKNSKIYSENKDLKFKAELLEMDRNVLKQSLEQSERAFQEQVSLRLRFQQKISDLHNLHRELQIKHYKLFSDFQLKNNQLVYFKDKSNFYYDENIRIKKELAAIEDIIAEKQRDCKLAVELAAKLKKYLSEKGTYDVQRRIQKKISENIIRQKEIIEVQLSSKLKNIQTAMECSDKSYKQLTNSYYQSLDENKRLVSKLNSELSDITRRLVELKSLNLSNAKYLSEIQLLNAKIDQKIQIVNELQANLQVNLAKMGELELELQTRISTNQAFEQTIRQANLTISKLKHVNEELQASNHQIEQINEALSSKLKEAEQQLNIFKESSKEWRAKYDKQVHTSEKYKIKSKILEEQIPKLQSNLKISIEQAQGSKKVEEKKLKRVLTQLAQKTVELDKVKSYYQNVQDKLKNEQFQRKNVLIQYKHLLNAYEQLSEVIKEQAKKISQGQSNFEEAALQNKLAKIQFKDTENRYKAQLQQQSLRIKHYEQNQYVNSGQVHPMLLQDALSHLLRLNRQIECLQEAAEEIDMQKQELIVKMQEQYIKSSEQQKQKQAELNQLIKRKELQLQYQGKKAKAYVQKIEYLQLTIIAKEIKEQEKHAQSYKQRQKKYLEVITDNNFKVNTLMGHLESIENYNEQLVQTTQENSEQISALSEKVSGLTKQNQHLINVNNQLTEEAQRLEETRQNLLRILAQKQQIISTHLPEHRKLRESASSKKLRKSREKSPSSKIKKGKSQNTQLPIRPITVPTQQLLVQRQEQGKREMKLFKEEGWRQDFSQKLKSSFGYYS